jgi:nitrous oxidase accessory protein
MARLTTQSPPARAGGDAERIAPASSQPGGLVSRQRRRAAELLLLLLASPGAAAAQKDAVADLNREVTVSPGGPVPSIAAAIQLVEPGGLIRVLPGVYDEATILVDRAVQILGEGWPVLDGAGQRQIMTVLADGVAIRGLVFRNVPVSYIDDLAAIRTDDVFDCIIEGNRFENTFFAIYLARTGNCRIANNEVLGRSGGETASGNGIHLWYSKGITVEGNLVRGHRDGIYFEFVEDSSVRDNVSAGNFRYGLHFMFSNECTYTRNVFRNNGAGVAVMYTKNVLMKENRFEDNWGSAAFGLLLKDISDSRIEDNRFRRNTVGVYMEGSNRVQLARNEFLSNGWAVRIMANSMDNLFTRNNFVGNSFDVTTNSRYSFSTFRENYWDNYEGYDLDRDGYGDVPFRPVRLFALIVARNPTAMILLRSFFVDMVNIAERLLPVLTPETLKDERPLMRRAS